MAKKNKRGLLDRKPTGILGKIAAALGAGPAQAETEPEPEVEPAVPEHVLRWAATQDDDDDDFGDEEEKTIIGFGDLEHDDEPDLELKPRK